MNKLTIIIAFLCGIIIDSNPLNANPNKDSTQVENYMHSIDFCPLSPVMGIYAIHYTRKISPKSEILAGPSYMRIQHEGIGHTNAPGFIVGYRRYFWRNLHMDYQLMPMWDRYYEMNEDKTYPVGFDLWNEFRLGYVFDFKIKELPVFLNVQWPLGFIIYSDGSAKPESFKSHAKENPLFYFPPFFFLGVRF
jgi:hypothetical protein